MKTFLSKYFPCAYVEDVFSIQYRQLYRSGIRAIIFDIDNTLVPHGADSNPEIDLFFRQLHDIGFKTLLLSNNSDSRIRRFMANIDTLYIADAEKPAPAGFEKALKMLGTGKRDTVMIGDTVFTDIAGANAAGIPSILVKYIGYYKKERKGIRRRLESLLLLLYRLSKCSQTPHN